MTYDTLASPEMIAATEKALAERGFLPETVATGADALARIKALVPAGSSIMNGSSRTLEQIGYVDLLKSGAHGWNNLHHAILEEKDPAKKSALRKQSVLSDFYLGSAHAIAQTGEIVVASNSGSQLPHLAFTSPNLILVVSTQKIMPDFAAAIARLQDYVLPQEDARMKELGMGGSAISKLLVINREPSFMKRKLHVLLVNEKLGF